jgi:hypothetical protein
LFTPFFEDFSAAQPFLLQQVNNQLVHDSYLSRTIDFFFFFLSLLWIYLWLAETSQQPISQTSWLKVTPHCNHCNIMIMSHFLLRSLEGMPKNTQSAADQPNNLAEGHPSL